MLLHIYKEKDDHLDLKGIAKSFIDSDVKITKKK